MKKYVYTITETNIKTIVLAIYADSQAEADVKATVGPLSHIKTKEGVEVVGEEENQQIIVKEGYKDKVIYANSSIISVWGTLCRTIKKEPGKVYLSKSVASGQEEELARMGGNIVIVDDGVAIVD